MSKRTATHKETHIPQLRFGGFDDNWEQRKVGDFLTESRVRGNTGLDAKKLTVKLWGKGVVEKNDFGGSEHTQYFTRRKGQFIYSKLDFLNSAFGVIPEKLDNYESTADLPAFDLDGMNPYFMYFVAIQESFYLKHGSIADGSRKAKRIHADTFLNMPVMVPTIDEQNLIVDFLQHLDNLITLHQHKHERLKSLKQAMLQKMFPREGELVPEIRFEGFTEPWEQRKVSDLVQIERGGSPRPIDDFITDSPDGLNWVKIGDAPAQGNRIIKTAEKIRPEGLSKTREVHPGDLILSNSMSFGKPYIMGIDGCIHDGWLLIRNTYNIFDLTFLCHLLGTPQMLNQYRSLAAGSTVNNLNKELVGNTVITIPKIDEQRVIGQYLEQLDRLITLHQRKYEKLLECKKTFLTKMFPS